MDKVLLTSGCSWTDKNFISTDTILPVELRGGWPMWPEIIAKTLGMKSVNTGKCGADNKYIFDSIIDGLDEYKNVGLVIIMLSSWDRFSYMGKPKFPLGNFYMGNKNEFKEKRKLYDIQREFDDAFFGMNDDSIKRYARDVIDTNMRYIFLISEFLKKQNIPFLIFQGVPTFPIPLLNEIKGFKARYDDKDLIKDISSNRYHNYIKSNQNIVGFPFLKLFNGYNLNHLINEERVSELDEHPNKAGQAKIAKHIMEIIDARNINI